MRKRTLVGQSVSLNLYYEDGTTRTLTRKSKNLEHSMNILRKELRESGEEGLISMEFEMTPDWEWEIEDNHSEGRCF